LTGDLFNTDLILRVSSWPVKKERADADPAVAIATNLRGDKIAQRVALKARNSLKVNSV